ncbi:Uncharacterized protein APZ42_005446 [Daphnia magna]|uniref:Secreted protein n=1 Tax=Daphnia magna TaxID=35525 RepID=A0A162CTE7_9CRUS|nr:Uncharacterized protein APZ42_005446 [Daphnia magna]
MRALMCFSFVLLPTPPRSFRVCVDGRSYSMHRNTPLSKQSLHFRQSDVQLLTDRKLIEGCPLLSSVCCNWTNGFH